MFYSLFSSRPPIDSCCHLTSTPGHIMDHFQKWRKQHDRTTAEQHALKNNRDNDNSSDNYQDPRRCSVAGIILIKH